MPTADNPHLHRAVLDSPEDDAPRLVYADWLEEQGETDRAAFIRVQVERARLPDDDPRQSALEAREWRLRAAHGLAWLDLPAHSALRGEYRRGFLEVLGTTAGRWLERRDDLLGRFPLRVLRLGKITGLSQEETIARLREVDAPDVLIEGLRADRFPRVRADEFLPELARLPELAGLRGFEFTPLEDYHGAAGNEIGDAFLAGFLQAPALRALESLGLVQVEPGRRSLDILGDPSWTRLRALDLSFNTALDPADGPRDVSSFDAETLLRFTRSATWERLESLNLKGSVLQGADPAWLADGLARGRLRDLNLLLVDGIETWIEALCRAPIGGTLHTLRVSNEMDQDIPGAAVTRLVAAPAVAGLRTLELDAGDVGDEVLRAIARSPALAELRALSLGTWRTVGDDAFDALLEAPFLERLTHLSFVANITDDQLARLAGCPRVRRLRHLGVGSQHCRAAGVKALLTSPYLEGLTSLDLNCPRSEVPIDLLIDPPARPHLASLAIRGPAKKDDLPAAKVRALLEAPQYAYVGSLLGGMAVFDLWRERFGGWHFFQRERPEYM